METNLITSSLLSVGMRLYRTCACESSPVTCSKEQIRQTHKVLQVLKAISISVIWSYWRLGINGAGHCRYSLYYRLLDSRVQELFRIVKGGYVIVRRPICESLRVQMPAGEGCNSNRGVAEVTIASFSPRPQGYLKLIRRRSHWRLTNLENGHGAKCQPFLVTGIREWQACTHGSANSMGGTVGFACESCRLRASVSFDEHRKGPVADGCLSSQCFESGETPNCDNDDALFLAASQHFEIQAAAPTTESLFISAASRQFEGEGVLKAASETLECGETPSCGYIDTLFLTASQCSKN